MDDEGNLLEYLPEREYQNISEGKSDRPAGIKEMPRTYVFERKGMPPGPQTDVGWIPPETKKKLKAEEKARKEAEKAAAEKEGAGATAATAEKDLDGVGDGAEPNGSGGDANGEKKEGE